jgi:hypothetical protein
MNTNPRGTTGKHASSVTYRHDGDKYEVTVGGPRKRYRRRTGPRGGYIKNAGWYGWSDETGSTVTDIVDAGRCIEVFSEEPSLGWANPSYVGHDEIMSIQWAVPQPGADADSAEAETGIEAESRTSGS